MVPVGEGHGDTNGETNGELEGSNLASCVASAWERTPEEFGEACGSVWVVKAILICVEGNLRMQLQQRWGKGEMETGHT